MVTASWVDDPFLAVDTETTGIDVWSDRIVEVAAVLVLPDGTVADTYSTIVNPGVDIPEGASAVHGITTARARDEGVAPAEALQAIAERIFRHGHRPLVMFNARFDWPILLAEAERHGVEFPFLAPVLDPFLVDKMLDQYRRGSRKLVAVAEHYDVELDEADAHGAVADAVASARVMRQIVARYPQVGERSLASVFLRQVRGYERWRTGFVDYKHSRGELDFRIAPGWPIPAELDGGLPVVSPTPEPATRPVEAPQDLPEPAPAPGAAGEGVDEPPTSTPDPTPADDPVEQRGVKPADVAKLAQQAFKADYDAAPRGQKTKTLQRLRHAFTYACTARAWHLDDCTPAELAAVHQRLTHLLNGQMGYRVLEDRVEFFLAGSGATAVVSFEQIEAAA